jgi:hypothetical protein
MDVSEIVQKYLKDNGYDGLYSLECGCKIDDLCPCGMNGIIAGCKGGYLCKCDPETCHADGDCEWHIGPKEQD